jgi:hypothetical protein
VPSSVARAHHLDRIPLNHEKAGASIADFDEARFFGHAVRVVDFKHVAQRRGGRIGTRGFDGLPDLVPIDVFDRIHGGTHFGAALDETQNLFGFEADIGIEKQKIGRGLVFEELRKETCPRPGDQRVAVLEQDLERQAAIGADQLLQLEQRGRVKNR